MKMSVFVNEDTIQYIESESLAERVHVEIDGRELVLTSKDGKIMIDE